MKNTAYSRITRLLAFSLLGLWLLFSLCLTVVTAQEIYDALYEQSYAYAASISQSGSLPEFYDPSSVRYGYQYERPDFFEYELLLAMGRKLSASYHTIGHYDTGDRDKLIRNISYPLETAILLYDAKGDLLHSSADDILYFPYCTQEEWQAGMDAVFGPRYGWIDISQGKNADWKEDPYRRFRTIYAGVHNLEDLAALRVTGYFEGTELKPVVMHYVTESLIWNVVEEDNRFSLEGGTSSFLLSQLDKAELLDWQLQFDHSDAYEKDSLVTVYITYPEMWSSSDDPLTYGEQPYENLAALTQALDLPFESTAEYYSHSRFSLTELLLFDHRSFPALSTDGQPLQESEDTPALYLVTAVRSNPLACAASALRNLYAASGMVTLLLFLLLRSSIKKRFLIDAQH